MGSSGMKVYVPYEKYWQALLCITYVHIYYIYIYICACVCVCLYVSMCLCVCPLSICICIRVRVRVHVCPSLCLTSFFLIYSKQPSKAFFFLNLIMLWVVLLPRIIFCIVLSCYFFHFNSFFSVLFCSAIICAESFLSFYFISFLICSIFFSSNLTYDPILLTSLFYMYKLYFLRQCNKYMLFQLHITINNELHADIWSHW